MTISDLKNYVQGNIRYFLFYNPYGVGLIRDHILEQILSRVISMDEQCYNEGQCKMCGCKTTALQMCDKACDKPCYPSMLSKEDWELVREMPHYIDEDSNLWKLTITGDGVIFKLIEDEQY